MTARFLKQLYDDNAGQQEENAKSREPHVSVNQLSALLRIGY